MSTVMSIVEGLEMRTDILPPCRCSRQTVIAAVHGIGQCQSVLVLADNRTALGLDGFDSTSGRAGDAKVNGCGEELSTLSRKTTRKTRYAESARGRSFAREKTVRTSPRILTPS